MPVAPSTRQLKKRFSSLFQVSQATSIFASRVFIRKYVTRLSMAEQCLNDYGGFKGLENGIHANLGIRSVLHFIFRSGC